MSKANPFKVGDLAIHPQRGDLKVTSIVTNAQTPAVTLEGLCGAIPTNILKQKVSIKKPTPKVKP